LANDVEEEERREEERRKEGSTNGGNAGFTLFNHEKRCWRVTGLSRKKHIKYKLDIQ